MPCSHVIFNLPGRWIRRAVPASRFSNFFVTDGFGVTDIPLSRFVSHDASSAVLANTFGAPSSGTPGTTARGFEVLSSPTITNASSFHGLTGDPGLLSLVLGPFKVLPAEACGGSQIRKTNTPLFRMQQDASLNPCASLSHRSHPHTGLAV